MKDLSGVGPLFEKPFERGMAESARAGGKWTDAQVASVDNAIRTLALRGGDFTADDVWRLVPHVPVTKGLASRLNVAARAGLIVNTGRLAIARRGGDHDHAQRLSVWTRA